VDVLLGTPNLQDLKMADQKDQRLEYGGSGYIIVGK